MQVLKFEVANWNSPDAQSLAVQSFEAQAAALGTDTKTLDKVTFSAMAQAIDSLLTALNIQKGQIAYVNANAAVDNGGGIVMNLAVSISPIV